MTRLWKHPGTQADLFWLQSALSVNTRISASTPPQQPARAGRRIPVRALPSAASGADRSIGIGIRSGRLNRIGSGRVTQIDEEFLCRSSVCVCQWVCRSRVAGGSISRPGLLGLGSCVRAGPLGFRIPGKRIWRLVYLLRVSRSVCSCVSACRSAQLLRLRRVAPLCFPSASSRLFSAGLAR